VNSNIRRVGVVGLGKMGFPMARYLRKAGFEVSACDVSAAARAQAEHAGIKVAASPKAAAAATDFVIVVVGFDAEAETVVLGADGIAAGARPGLIVGIASTVAPRTMTKIAAKLEGSGIVLLESGVMASIKTCSNDWCRIQGSGFDGWIEQGKLWGAYPGEDVE